MDYKKYLPYWKAALVANKIMSEGAFSPSEEEFFALCTEHLQRLDPSLQGVLAETAGRDDFKKPLVEIAGQLLECFAVISKDPEQEARFHEVLAELRQCATPDDYDEFKISLNIFLNFYRKTLEEMEQDRLELRRFLEDMGDSIQVLQGTGKDFLELLEDFKLKLESIDSTQKMEVLLGLFVAHCDRIKAQGGELYEQLFRTHRRLVRLRAQLEKIQLKAGGPPPKQLVESRVFREKFRNILQNTRLQRENVTLILCRIQNLGELEERLGGEMLLRILKHVIASFCGLLRKNDLITRLDRDVVAILLTNVPIAGARPLAERLLATVQGLRFRYQDQPYRVNGQFGIAGCRMHDTIETIIRKALLAIDMAPTQDQSVVLTEAEIPPDLLDTIYSI